MVSVTAAFPVHLRHYASFHQHARSRPIRNNKFTSTKNQDQEQQVYIIKIAENCNMLYSLGKLALNQGVSINNNVK